MSDRTRSNTGTGPRADPSAAAFHWDGTEAGFRDLLNFFKMHGCQLNAVHPVTAQGGTPALEAEATVLKSGQPYSFRFDRNSAFVVEATGRIAVARVQPGGVFQNTEFALRIFREGLVLAGPEPKRRAWYKRWWVWLLILLIPLAAVLGIGATGTSEDEPSADETAEIAEQEARDLIDRIRDWAFFQWLRDVLNDDNGDQPAPEPPPAPAPDPTQPPAPDPEPTQPPDPDPPAPTTEPPVTG